MDNSDYKKENKELKLQLLKDQQRIEILEQKQRDSEQKQRDSEQKQRDLEQTIVDLIQRNEELRRIIKYYDNSNTPSSVNSLTKQRRNRINQQKRAEKEKNGEPPAKRGPKYGHKGVTRKNKIDKTIQYSLTKCPKCNGKHIRKINTIQKIVVDIPKQPVMTTQHVIPTYHCRRCNCDVQSPKVKDAGIPKKGIFGKNICVFATLLFTVGTSPYRKVRLLLRYMYDLDISVGATVNLIRNTATKVSKKAVDTIKKVISKSDILHVDETAIHLNAINVWIWAIHDPKTKNVWYAIRHGRGARDLRNIMPVNWNGVVVCDGWRAYTTYPKRQAVLGTYHT